MKEWDQIQAKQLSVRNVIVSRATGLNAQSSRDTAAIKHFLNGRKWIKVPRKTKAVEEKRGSETMSLRNKSVVNVNVGLLLFHVF